MQPVEGLGPDGQNVDVLHVRLRTAILRGELAPGRELSQVQLASQLGVSRTPLREALRMLQREGLVETEPNRRVRIAGFSVADMEAIYVARIPMEVVGLRLTIPRLEAENDAELEGDLAQMAHFAAQQDYERWEVPHRRFHRRLVAGSGSRLVTMLSDLSDYAERYRRFYTTQVSHGWERGLVEHRAILDAVIARDAGAAARQLADHLAYVAFRTMDTVEPGHDAALLRDAVEIAVPSQRSSRRRPRS